LPCSDHGAGHGGSGATGRLGIVLAVTAVYALAEAVGGWLANSLALLADAGHMLTDIMALSLALGAAWFARRPPDPSRTYGYQRVEILAALFNGLALVVIAVFIFVEAWERFSRPLDVDYVLMAAVAAGGLAVNALGAWLLHGRHHGMNVRAAYLHVLGDLLGSVGALLAAGAIGFLGWRWADAAVSVLIGAVIVVGAVRLVLGAVNVLLEGAPSHIKTEDVRDCLVGLDGVAEVHDLHLWSLGGRTPLLTAHLVPDDSLGPADVLRRATTELRERFGITHTTLQIDPPDYNVLLDGGPVRGRSSPPPPRSITDRT
jgi:cobalt-zinc-cadmium efflux system protein